VSASEDKMKGRRSTLRIEDQKLRFHEALKP
jgi:hypothetical protein